MTFLQEAEFWVAVSFLIFVGVMIYAGIHKKIAVALDARGARIKADLDEARRLRDEAAPARVLPEKLGQAEQEAAAIVAEAQARPSGSPLKLAHQDEDFVVRRTSSPGQDAQAEAGLARRARRRRRRRSLPPPNLDSHDTAKASRGGPDRPGYRGREADVELAAIENDRQA